MRLKCLHMKDFRGIRTLIIDFEPDLTVIVGRNGAGKTSILDALGELARYFRSHLKGPRRGGITQQLSTRDVRSGTSGFTLSLTFDLEDTPSDTADDYPLQIMYDADSETFTYPPHNKIRQWSDQTDFRPRFVHYRQNRGFEIQERTRTRKVGGTFDPEYIQDLSLQEDLQAIDDLEEWWDKRDAEEGRIVRDDNDPDYRDPQLEAIRELITKIDGFKGIKFSSTASPPGLQLLKNDATTIHVSSLSGGERSYIILLADLARRLQVFAPDKSLEEIPAIVLIDEIELNLHPAWQSRIAPELTAVFKACQFIVTTHSAQVLSGIESKSVRVLHQKPLGPTEVTTPLSTKGRTSNYLLEGVFHAPERYPPIDRLVDDFNRAIDHDDAVTAEKKLTEIEVEVPGDISTLLVLRKRLKKLRENR